MNELTFLRNPQKKRQWRFCYNRSGFVACLDLDEVWLEVKEQRARPEPPEPLVKMTRPFVLKLAYPVDSEVDGSEPRAAARMPRPLVQHSSSFSPFWHSLLPLIPC